MPQQITNDIIGHINIKMFQVPMLNIDSKTNRVSIVSGNGRGIHFKNGDKLPIHSMYYQFPKYFYIITYDDDDMLICVEDGKYIGIQSISKDIEENLPVYDIFGNSLVVLNPEKDIPYIRECYQEYIRGHMSAQDFAQKCILDQDKWETTIKVFGKLLYLFRENYTYGNEYNIKYIKPIIKKFIESNPHIISDYKNWLTNEECISFSDIDKIVKLTLT